MITIKPLTIMAARPTPPTPPGPSIPSVTIGNQIWSTVYVDPTISGIQSAHTETIHGQTIHYYTYAQTQNMTFGDGWRVPSRDDLSSLRSYFYDMGYGGNSLISTLDGGDDLFGLNLYITGIWNEEGSSLVSEIGAFCTIAYYEYNESIYGFGFRLRNSNVYGSNINSYLEYRSVPIRLVKDVT